MPNRPARTPGIVYPDAPPQIDRVLFLCGLHRSGTTLVEHYLAASRRLTILRAQIPENEGQHAQSVYPAALVHGGMGAFAFAEEMAPPPPDADTAAGLRATILADWAPYMAGDAPVLLEKSPPNLTKIPWLRRVFPRSRFLVITRDPRVVSAATARRSDIPFERLMRHWAHAHARARADWGDDCTHLRYEAFCADPERALADFCEAARLPLRDTVRDLPERFRSVRNTNADYLDALGRPSLGAGIWNAFGYVD